VLSQPNIRPVSLALGVIAASAAGAARAEDPRSLTALVPPATEQAFRGPEGAGCLFEEDFEGISLGGIDGVAGWTATSTAFVELSGAQAGASPAPGFGDRSLAVNWESAAEVGTALSPDFGGLGAFGRIDVDVIVYSTPGQATDVLPAVTPVNTETGLINARVVLQPGGAIEVLQVAGGSGVFMSTTGSWSLDVATQISVEVLPGNVLNVYQDDVLIFTGHDIAVELGAGGGGINRLRVAVFNDNASGPYPYFDNIKMAAAAPVGETERVSVSSGGVQANSTSFEPSISADGRFVVFDSLASNLVSGDFNNEIDIFIHDRQTGDTVRASLSSTGAEANGNSLDPSISANGEFVVFTSSADNLVLGDTNTSIDVFVHDLIAGDTTRVSVSSSGAETNGSSSIPTISADGRFVAFASIASNLVPGDTNGATDIFVHDRDANGTGVFDEPGGISTTRVDVASDGSQSDNFSNFPSISDDGRYVAFESFATNLVSGDGNNSRDVFVHDRVTGENIRVSVSSAGDEADKNSVANDISADGRFVVFSSSATNLVAGDTNGASDYFVHDRDANETGVFDEPGGVSTTRVSVSSEGVQADDFTCYPPEAAISDDGRFVAFKTKATNLVPGDTNDRCDVFLHDRAATAGGGSEGDGGIETTRVSVSSAGGQGNGNTFGAAISADGSVIAFRSTATNLVLGDSNDRSDIFTHTPTSSPPQDPADLNGDGKVDGADLGLLLLAWDPVGPADSPADLNGDNVVDGADLGLLLLAWSP